MPMTRSTATAGGAALWTGLSHPTNARPGKHNLVKNAVRNAGRCVLKKKLTEEEGDTHIQQHSLHIPRETATSAPLEGTVARDKRIQTATTVRSISAATRFRNLNKRKRQEMGVTTIAIHEDATPSTQKQPIPEYQVMTEHDPNVQISDDDDEEDSEDEIDETVAEDMHKLEENFQGISQKYRLINRIGEGTFSTVYKAEQLDFVPQDAENEDPDAEFAMPSTKKQKTRNLQHRYVALKKIYVTSSPNRILNELELLYELRDSEYICPLLTAFRHHDQVVAVLPYFRHLDFRLYYRDFLTNDLRHYFASLFSGLAYVHKAGILHRDIKPTNFLYDHTQKHGVLVDFGLAERQGTDWQPCFCQEHKTKRRDRFLNSYAVQQLQQSVDVLSAGHPKQDNRPSRRANRAGTRGFRAPEVLLKCTAQTTKIDIWSVGVILLTLLSRRFPFFNSADDIDAMIEIASIFGKKKMQGVAAMHGSVFETNIETIGDKGFTLEKIVLWASCREKEDNDLHPGEAQAVDLLAGLLELDPSKRLSAKEALNHVFFTKPVENEQERAEREEAERLEAEAAEYERIKALRRQKRKKMQTDMAMA